jgi:hypothetical protein
VSTLPSPIGRCLECDGPMYLGVTHSCPTGTDKTWAARKLKWDLEHPEIGSNSSSEPSKSREEK